MPPIPLLLPLQQYDNNGDLAGFSTDPNGVGHAVMWLRH
jgi:hypothetical protein